MKQENSKSRENSELLSIIIPAYKAEKFIAKNLLQMKHVLDEIGNPYELICVVDGYKDDTFKNAQKIANKYPKLISVVGYQNNLGKGHAVRFGMAHANGDIIGFVDAGSDISRDGLAILLEHFRWYKADIIIASKRHPASKVNYPWQRKILSFCYQILVRVLFGLRVRDTQVGMKLFRRKVLKAILPRLLVKAWAFDIEMLAVSNYLGFKRIYEAPVKLRMEFGGSSVLTSNKFIKTVYRMIWDTVAVFYRLKILHYYDSKNENKWITPEYLTFSKKT